MVLIYVQYEKALCCKYLLQKLNSRQFINCKVKRLGKSFFDKFEGCRLAIKHLVTFLI